jgi:hypothetical protein
MVPFNDGLEAALLPERDTVFPGSNVNPKLVAVPPMIKRVAETSLRLENIHLLLSKYANYIPNEYGTPKKRISS